MRVYRLTKEKYKKDISGRGAETYGGRWNSKGIRMLYTSDSRALAKFEVAVNISLAKLPKNYYLTTLEIPDDLICEYNINNLKGKNWIINPPMKFTQIEGNKFISSAKALAMKVPSSVVKGDYNYLINPRHEKADMIKIISCEKFRIRVEAKYGRSAFFYRSKLVYVPKRKFFYPD